MFFQICYLIIGFIIVGILYKIYDTILDSRVDNVDSIANNAELDYWISKEMGDKEKEYNALLTIFYSSLINPILKGRRMDRYNDLKDTYEENFTALGKQVPKYPFKD